MCLAYFIHYILVCLFVHGFPLVTWYLVSNPVPPCESARISVVKDIWFVNVAYQGIDRAISYSAVHYWWTGDVIGIERVADLFSEHREQHALLCTARWQFYSIISAPLRDTATQSCWRLVCLRTDACEQTSVYSEYFSQSTCVSGVKFHPKVCKNEHASAVPRRRKYMGCRQKIESRIQCWTDVQYEDVIFFMNDGVFYIK